VKLYKLLGIMAIGSAIAFVVLIVLIKLFLF
jgi:hypothetical protein